MNRTHSAGTASADNGVSLIATSSATSRQGDESLRSALSLLGKPAEQASSAGEDAGLSAASRFRREISSQYMRQPRQAQRTLATTVPRTANSDQANEVSGNLSARQSSSRIPGVVNLEPEIVAILSSCPICGVDWTAKKSAMIKASHVAKCARQRSWTDQEAREVVMRAAREKCDLEAEKNRARGSTFAQMIGGEDHDVLWVQAAGGLEGTRVLQDDIDEQRRASRRQARAYNGLSGRLAKAAKVLDSIEAAPNENQRDKSLRRTPPRNPARSLHNMADTDQPSAPASTPAFIASRLQKGYAPLTDAAAAHCSMWNLVHSSSVFAHGLDYNTWVKALRYEPLPIDAFAAASSAERVRAPPQAATRKFLEEEGITFFTPESRHVGNHRRH